MTQKQPEQPQELISIEQFDSFHPRAMKLIRKQKPFIVIADDEPYFDEAYRLIRAHEEAKGTWTEEDEDCFWYSIKNSLDPDPDPEQPQEGQMTEEMKSAAGINSIDTSASTGEEQPAPESQEYLEWWKANRDMFKKSRLTYREGKKIWDASAARYAELVEAYENFVKQTKMVAEKFVDKVETGKARSKETYGEMLGLLKFITALEKLEER